MNKPNFFIVGQPKTGTTTLYNLLKYHPEIYMAENKEPCYFCKDFWRVANENQINHNYVHRTEAKYLELYKNVKQEKIVGEATPRYLYSKVAAREIYKFNPNSKILIMLREPVDFLRSYHAQMLRNINYNYETVESFLKALSLEKERKKGCQLPKDCLVQDFFYYSEYIKYAEQIKRYCQFFPQNQIKIILYDELKSNTNAVLKNVLDFLEVDKEYIFEIKRYNQSRGITSKKAQLFLYEINKKREYKLIKKMYQLMTNEQIRIAISQKIINPMLTKPMHKLSNYQIQNLKKKYKSEVVKVENLLQLNLVKLWGYDFAD